MAFRPRAWRTAVLFVTAVLVGAPQRAWSQDQLVTLSRDGALTYRQDDRGNRVPDFSHCGYAGGDRSIPTVRPQVVVEPVEGDDGPRIQAAIDHVARLEQGEDGFRGAVLLGPGEFQVAGHVTISHSGVVLRGSGAGPRGTTLVATGTDRRPLIDVADGDDRTTDTGRSATVVDEYVPVGARVVTVDDASQFRVGDTVLVTRPSTDHWIEELGARAFGIGWRPGSRDLVWDRVVTNIDGNRLTLDAPITTAIERRFGGATVAPYAWAGRIANVGIEDLTLVSAHDADRPHDEDHAWHGITMNNVADAWVRRVRFRHFAGGAVALWENTKHITVEDCLAEAPISEIGGYRRHTYFTQGQLALFQRCWSEHGRHDFAVGHCAAGPNAFVNCYASQARDFSGPIESWAAGVLYDNVRIDGADLALENRWSDPLGAGWAAANCVVWQCQAATIRAFRPPTANNWVCGFWGQAAGDAAMESESDFVRPRSLYQAQLAARVGREAARRVEPLLLDPVASTSPTYDEAADFVTQSNQPARQLVGVIEERLAATTHELRAGRSANEGVRSIEEIANLGPEEKSNGAERAAAPLAVRNGWLVVGDTLKVGRRLSPIWWRGNIRPKEARGFGPAVTRFVPGRTGTGFTDDLADVASMMTARGIASLEHHWGLWYDRRRDDHLMVRRADGNVYPPFYEQPFARSGEGTAWDGLSKYDLTKPNPWYWNRLRAFAEQCDRHGLVLLHQNYFQHNILEAGGHWADCPWRPANNINETGLPEPPPYIGDKRIFIAHKFYDIANEPLRELHRAYIRQCLDNFARTSNVLQLTGAEYTGPLEFTQFWIDTIAQWQAEHDQDVLVCLSATKDVQDAILADPERNRHVDVIDIRYWHYEADGDAYAPPGGANMAPRQHARQLHPQPASFASIAQGVSEYRGRFPDKAVTYSADSVPRGGEVGWAVLMGGGSLPPLRDLPAELKEAIPHMTPRDDIVATSGTWCLASDERGYLVYAERNVDELEINLPASAGGLRARWLDPESGGIVSETTQMTASPLRIPAKSQVLWLAPDETPQ